MEQDKLLTAAEMRSITRLSWRQVKKFIAEGTFPTGIKIGYKSVRWRLSDINRWIGELEGGYNVPDKRDQI